MSAMAKRLRSVLAAGSILGASFGGAAWAQSVKPLGMEQVTKPLPETTVYRGSYTFEKVVLDDVSKDPYFQRIKDVASHILNGLRKAAPGAADFIVLDETEKNGLLLRYQKSSLSMASCNSGQTVMNQDGLPYLIVPDAWVDDKIGVKEDRYYSDRDMAFAAMLGIGQAALVCDRAFPGRSLKESPYATAMTDIGFVEGLNTLKGITGLSGTDEFGFFRFLHLTEQLIEERVAGKLSSDSFDTLIAVSLDRAPLDQPFLTKGIGRERFKLMAMRWFGVELANLYKTSPTDPRDEMAVMEWLESGLVSVRGEDVQLGKILPIMDYVVTSLSIFPDTKIDRKTWQKGFTNDPDAGCAHVELSKDKPFQDVSFSLKPAASQCVTVSWAGKKMDAELPPEFAILATSPGGVDVLSGLQLAADQRFEREIEGVSKVSAGEVELKTDLPWHFFRNAFVVENPKTGKAVKNWEIAFKPDVAFKDGKMTLLFTNLNKESLRATKEGSFTLTIGDGVHEVKTDLDVTTFHEDDYSCERPKKITPPIPAGRLQLIELGRTYFGNDGIGYDKAPSFGGKFVLGMDDPQMCSRLLGAIGTGGLGEDMAMTFGGATARKGMLPNAPQNICAARMAKLQGMMASAMAGKSVAMPKAFELEFQVTPKSRLTGPGTYDADFTLMYTQPELEEEGLIEPTYADGEGTVTVISQTDTHMHLRYSVTLEDREEACDGRLEGRITGEVTTPFALASEQNLVMHALHPRDVMGEKVWFRMPESVRADMVSEWRAEPVSMLREIEVEAAAPAGANGGIAGGCVVTDDEIATIIESQVGQLPVEQQKDFRDMYEQLYDPNYPREVLCMMKEEYLSP